MDAQIVWQEWQTAGQARLLAVDVIEGSQILALLQRQADLLVRPGRSVAPGRRRGQRHPDHARAGHRRAADRAGPAAGPGAAAAVQAAPARGAARPAGRRGAAARRRRDLPPLDLAEARRALPDLADRRPDLVALRLGYAAEDEKVRAAILAQFPKLTFGVTGGSDNSNVRNIGPQITLELPIFDRNQGNIAIERATRQQLHDEYAARLAAAIGQVQAAASEIEQLRRAARAGRARAGRHAADGRAARRPRSPPAAIDERSYVDLVTADLAKAAQILILRAGAVGAGGRASRRPSAPGCRPFVVPDDGARS